MPCYHPTRVFQKNGQLHWKTDWRYAEQFGGQVFNVPCRDCIGCNLAEQRQWSVRCFHEALTHVHRTFDPVSRITTEVPNSCVITLTFNDEHLPADGRVNHKTFQLFMKRLRNHRIRYLRDPTPVRYFMCAEYGGKTSRPHFHAIIYGHTFGDQYKSISLDQQTNTHSTELDELWHQKAPGQDIPTNIGRATVDNFSFAGACYVAGYVAKKSSLGPTGPIETSVNTATGELSSVATAPEYRKMSTKPGLGHDYLVQNKQQNLVRIYESDSIKIADWTFHCPSYYDTLLERYRPDLVDQVQETRAEGSGEYALEWTQDRCDSAERAMLDKLQQRRDSL